MERQYHWSGKVSLRKQTVDTYVTQVANTFDNGGNLATTTPSGSGASSWTKTFTIKPQYHAATPDTDNFNRTAIVDNTDLYALRTYRYTNKIEIPGFLSA